MSESTYECEVCGGDYSRLLAEIERLNSVLQVAAGLISTMPEHSNKHPQDVLEWLHTVALNGERDRMP